MDDVAKVALITGASGGIGAQTAQLAARAGYDVAVHYATNEAAAQNVAAQVTAQGRRALTVAADLSDPAAVERVFETVDKAFGQLDALVNNAAIVAPDARVDEISAARLRRMFDVNAIAPFLAAGHAVKRMSTKNGNRGGVIVNISSGAARLGAANTYVDYAATKGALETLTVGLAQEVAREGIRVVGLRPGFIETGIHAKAGAPERGVRMGAGVPMGRAGTALEVAQAIVWLMSDQASYVTGAILDVTGGR